jgi:hypothetical protein
LLHICKLEWFKSKQMEIYVFVHKDHIGLQILTDTSERYFVYRKNLTVRMCASKGTLLYILGERGPGFLTL